MPRTYACIVTRFEAMSINIVVGAGGRSGYQCIRQLAAKAPKVRAVVRDPAKYSDAFSSISGIEVVAGDVRDK